MIYAVIRKIIKLAFFISIFSVLYIIYLNYTNQVVPKNIDELSAGEIGFITTGIKVLSETKVGDTICDASKPN